MKEKTKERKKLRKKHREIKRVKMKKDELKLSKAMKKARVKGTTIRKSQQDTIIEEVTEDGSN